MGCHVYIQDLETGEETFQKWTRIPPAYYDTEFNTQQEVETFVANLLNKKYSCYAERVNIPYNECCTNLDGFTNNSPSCRENYSFTKEQLDWILTSFKEGINKVVCA